MGLVGKLHPKNYAPTTGWGSASPLINKVAATAPNLSCGWGGQANVKTMWWLAIHPVGQPGGGWLGNVWNSCHPSAGLEWGHGGEVCLEVFRRDMEGYVGGSVACSGGERTTKQSQGKWCVAKRMKAISSTVRTGKQRAGGVSAARVEEWHR
ncbi:hypothetical protein SLA2020_261940 [Shorea laevis]